MSTLRTTNLQHASAASPAIVLASSGSATAQLSSINDGPIAGARNRIINGDMRIDQRNAGASGTAQAYTVDRWTAFLSQSSKLTWQQNAGSATPPAGFTHYLGATSSSAFSVAASDYFVFEQPIEGSNASDLAWGTANAKAVTLSFYARSSLTGTFGGSLQNEAQTRSYPFSYTISSANTWELKTIAIAGDTAGTWVTGTGVGIRLNFSMGAGSSASGTAGTWAGSNFWSATGATSVVGTNGATFYITGVQLEPGSVATPFERRSYGQELMLCQRYYEKSFDQSVAPAQASGTGSGSYNATQVVGQSAAQYCGSVTFKVPKRATPTITLFNPISSNAQFYNANTGGSTSSTASSSIGETGFHLNTITQSGSGAAGNGLLIHYTASAEL